MARTKRIYILMIEVNKLFFFFFVAVISKRNILIGHYNHYLSLDATIMVSRNCPIFGEHVFIIFVTQEVTIATVWPAKNTALGAYNSKKARWMFLVLSNFNKHDKTQLSASFEKKFSFKTNRVQSHLKVLKI